MNYLYVIRGFRTPPGGPTAAFKMARCNWPSVPSVGMDSAVEVGPEFRLPVITAIYHERYVELVFMATTGEWPDFEALGFKRTRREALVLD
jgi:hypothetical protein